MTDPKLNFLYEIAQITSVAFKVSETAVGFTFRIIVPTGSLTPPYLRGYHIREYEIRDFLAVIQ